MGCLIIQIKDARWLGQGGWSQCPRVEIGHKDTAEFWWGLGWGPGPRIEHKAIAELAESPAQLFYFWWEGGCSGYKVKNCVYIEPEFLRPANEYSIREMETINMH